MLIEEEQHKRKVRRNKYQINECACEEDFPVFPLHLSMLSVDFKQRYKVDTKHFYDAIQLNVYNLLFTHQLHLFLNNN